MRAQLDEVKSQQNDNRDIDVSTQPASIQNISVSTLTKKWKEIEEKVMQNTRGKTSSKKSKEAEGQAQKARCIAHIICISFRATHFNFLTI